MTLTVVCNSPNRTATTHRHTAMCHKLLGGKENPQTSRHCPKKLPPWQSVYCLSLVLCTGFSSRPSLKICTSFRISRYYLWREGADIIENHNSNLKTDHSVCKCFDFPLIWNSRAAITCDRDFCFKLRIHMHAYMTNVTLGRIITLY